MSLLFHILNELVTIEGSFFAVCALMIIGGALSTITQRTPIRSAFSLLVTLIGVGGLYLQLQAPLLGFLQMIVYVGAVVVLFLFVIMMMGPAASAPVAGKPSILVNALSTAAMIIVFAMFIGPLAAYPLGQPRVEIHAQPSFGMIETTGRLLFGEYLVPFEASSFLLLVAIVGAIAVARGRVQVTAASEKAGES
jgi:NADH-quinone oxidoreductase subunit J